MRGTFVHRVLELMMNEPPERRTIADARSAARDAWSEIGEDEDYASLGLSDEQAHRFRWDAWRNIERYFELEDPSAVDARRTEQDVRAEIGGVPFRGIVDRLDESPDGGLTITDYKTGKAPSPRFIDDRLSQVYLYAAALQAQGDEVSEVRLMYLSHGGAVDIRRPADADALESAVSEHQRTWGEINAAMETGAFPTKTGPLCSWCAYRAQCPAGMSEHQRRHGADD